MPNRREISSNTPIKRVAELKQIFVKHLPPLANLATDGVQYSAVITVGTTAISVFDRLVDPSIDMSLDEVEAAFTQEFNNLNAASVGTLVYYWQARQENQATTRAWVLLTPTLSKGVPTSGVSGDPSEDTLSGYFDLTSIPEAPVRVNLTVSCLQAAQFAGRVKNSSYVKLVGSVIPGT